MVWQIIPRLARRALTPPFISSILRSMSRARIAAVVVCLMSLVLAALILTDAVPGLRGPAPGTGEWYWPYLLRPFARWWPAALFALGLVLVGVWWVALRPSRRWPIVLVAGLALGLQLGLVYADRPNMGAELIDRTLSKDTTGYAAIAGELDDLNAFLREFPELMPAFDNEHARTHPPGFIAAYWLADRALRTAPDLARALAAPVRFWRCTDLWVLSRPASTAAGLLVGSWVPVLSAALVPVMAFFVARRLYRGPAAALAATLAAVIPALLVFSPTPDQVLALLSLVSLWPLLKGLNGRHVGWLALAGLVLSIMTMLSIGNVAWAGLLTVYTVLSARRRRWTTKDWAAGLSALAVGGLSLWLIYWLGWGVAPWKVVGVGLDQHYQLVTSQRAYSTWLAYNPLDALLFAGLAVVVGWGGLTVAALVRPNWRRSEAGLLAVLLAAALLLLALSGSTRGEVGRLWLVFMPLAAVLAGGGWTAAMGAKPLRPPGLTAPRLPGLEVALILLAQLAVMLAIGLAWRPLQAVILPVERPAMAAAPNGLNPLDVVFLSSEGRLLRLSGYRFGPVVNGSITAQLVWTALGPTWEPYTIFAHVLDGQGALVAQQDNWPVNGAWPTTCWRLDETIVDPYALQLPEDLPAGDYTLVVGVYGGPDGQRLRTAAGLDAIPLTRFTVGQ